MRTFNYYERRVRTEFNPDAMAAGNDAFSHGDKDLMSQAQKERLEEVNKRKKEEMKLQLSISEFDQEATAIKLRRDTAINNAVKKELKERTALNEVFSTEGGEVKELQGKYRELRIQLEKEKDAARATYEAAIGNLKKKNPDGYRNSDRRYDY